MAPSPLHLVVVDGESMRPALEPGDRLLVVRLRPRVGDVVALRHDGGTIVKRVAAIDDVDDTLQVLGDNAGASTDSRTFGSVPRTSIIGRAVYRYAPASRSGRVPSRRGR
jgi:nickel-type superoxide dismutase maturation protease